MNTTKLVLTAATPLPDANSPAIFVETWCFNE